MQSVPQEFVLPSGVSTSNQQLKSLHKDILLEHYNSNELKKTQSMNLSNMQRMTGMSGRGEMGRFMFDIDRREQIEKAIMKEALSIDLQ